MPASQLPMAPKPALSRFSAFLAAHRVALWSAGSVIGVLILWEIAADLGWISPLFFSSPTLIVNAGSREVQQASFWSDLSVSSTEFAVGYGLAMIVGVPLGFLIGWYRRVGYLLEPWVHGLNSTPSLALMPLVVLWFGLGLESKFAIVFISAVIPVVVNMYVGVKTIDLRLLRVAQSFGAGRRVLFRTVVLPSLMGFVFVAARIAVGRSVSGVVVGEFYAAQSGLAARIFQAGVNAQTNRLFFGALTITVLAMAAFGFVGVLQSRALSWRRTSINAKPGVGKLVVPVTRQSGL